MIEPTSRAGCAVPRLRGPRRVGTMSVAAMVLVLGVSRPAFGQAPEERDGMVPLITWYSAGRTDHFTTSDPAWRAAIGTVRPGQGDYRAVRIEGYVFSPDRPRPAGTVPLYHWWSGSRQDNFLTSDPAWRGEIGEVRRGQGDYRLFRLEGYAFDAEGFGRSALLQHWSGERQDNWTTSGGTSGAPGYSQYRTAGYVAAEASSGGGAREVAEALAEARVVRAETGAGAGGIEDAEWPTAITVSAQVIVRTGADDLRSGSRFSPFVRLRDGRVLRRNSLNCSREGGRVQCDNIDNGQQRSYEWIFAEPGPRVGDIERFGIAFTSVQRVFTDADDEWLVRAVELLLTARLPDGSVDTRVLFSGEGRPLIQFRGSGEWETGELRRD